ncbi:MAG: ATP synthase F1 subunit epsilon [Puniceicoccales bacterium]|jgi:F-type H+-transporting ATPase subunit epsilon|nr:ATP synthase F1 subunit epsilon [Puniceicoccales bacterium]
MALSIEIVTPERKAFESPADSVVLPTQSGEVNILPGHVPLTTLVSPGVVAVHSGATVEHLVVDKGFARILGDRVSILTEAAIDTDEIDLRAVEEAEARAQGALEAARTGKSDPAEIEKMEQILRFAAVQKLIKRPR